MADLQLLIDRLEEAEGPDRALDKEIATTIGGYEHRIVQGDHWWRLEGCLWSGGDEIIPDYTGSLDDAVALVERALPGWVWNVGGCQPDFLTKKDKPLGADLMGPVEWVPDREIGEEPVFDNYSASASTAPIAICLAVLRALQAQKGTDHEGE